MQPSLGGWLNWDAAARPSPSSVPGMDARLVPAPVPGRRVQAGLCGAVGLLPWGAGGASAALCSEAVAGADTAPVLGNLQRQGCTIFLCRLSESHFHPCHFCTSQEMGCAFSRGLKPSCCISAVQPLF